MWVFGLLACFAAVGFSDAKRVSFRAPHHEALIVTGGVTESQGSIRAGISEKLSRLESQTQMLDSYISDVEGSLHKAVALLEDMGEAEPKKNQSHAAGHSSAAHTKFASSKAALNKTAKAFAVKKFQKQVKDEKSVLENLFKHLKANIANFNKQESKDKVKNDKMKEKLEARLKKDEEALAMKNISAFEKERLTNATRLEKHELEYWSRDRDLEHHMFHSNLKMTHGLMSRVKSVIEAYKEAETTGKISPELMKKVHLAAPAQAFIEMRHDLKERAQLYRVHLRLGLQIARKSRREEGLV